MAFDSRKIGVGIVGSGVIFRNHLDALRALNNKAQAVAVSDLDNNRLQAATDAYFIPHAYRDYQKLLARQDVDVVVVCTPPNVHEKIVMDALRAGKYVVCEKPLAHTLMAADHILEVAREFPGKLSTVFQWRYTPEVERTKWLLDNGYLGKLVFGHFHHLSSLVGYDSSTYGWWGKWKVAGGGIVMTRFIHELDLICYFFGQPLEVKAEMATCCQPIESEDTFTATIKFASGAMVQCSGSLCANKHVVTRDIIGDKGSTHYPWAFHQRSASPDKQVLEDVMKLFPDPNRPAVDKASLPKRAIRKGLRMSRVLPQPKKFGPQSTHLGYWQKVLEAIESNKPLPIEGEEGRVALDLCVGIYSSAIQGKTVSLPLNSESPHYKGIHDYSLVHVGN